MINDKDPVFDPNWEAFKGFFTEMHVPARTILLREGEVARQAYYIRQGCLRLWFNDNGKDITFQFFFENQGVSSIESFRTGRRRSNVISTCSGNIPRSYNASPSILSPVTWGSPRFPSAVSGPAVLNNCYRPSATTPTSSTSTTTASTPL